jgi:PKD repeat protein
MRISSLVLASPTMTIRLTATITLIILASNFTIINAQQQVQSDGGLTATLNGSSFTRGETITVSGTVGERNPLSSILVHVIDPQSNEVEAAAVDVSADNTYTYSFVAGEQEEFDIDEPMVASGNYRMVVSYITPDFDREVVELIFAYNTAATQPAEPEALTTTTDQSAAADVQSTTTLFQSTSDSFSVQVPDGWVIHDVNNTGSTLLEETTQGYGILAQLCPEEQQRPVPSNAIVDSTTSCQQAQDVIHIIRYPNLETGTQPTNNITTYHLQKLQEVGYRGIQIVNSTNTSVNIIDAKTNQTISTVPAKNVGMTYSTSLAPNQTRTGYFVLTATDATAPNQGMTKGYSIFFEGNTADTSEMTTATTTPSGSLARTSLPAQARQVFDSFELISAEAPIEPLIVEITSDAEEGDIAPATFEFEADVAGGTGPYTYSWDFDDDGDDEDNGEDDEQTVSHTFEEAGSYDVDLTVTDSGGQNASNSIEVTVEEAPVEEEEEEEEEPSLAEEIVEEQEEEEPPDEVGEDNDNGGGGDEGGELEEIFEEGEGGDNT